jgi:hypothetical protein
MADTAPRKRRRRSAIEWVTSTGGLAIAAGLVILVFGVVRYAAISHARAWMVAGDPCPTMTPAELAASGYQLGHSFEYHGVRFARAYGYVNCDEVSPDLLGFTSVPVCQFNSPTVLKVTIPQASMIYTSPVRPMTVWVTEQGPHCVLNISARLKVTELERRLVRG